MSSHDKLKQYLEITNHIKALKAEQAILKQEIISDIKNQNTRCITAGNYRAEVRYQHQVTEDFIRFLKLTHNTHLIVESSTCKAYDELNKLLRFSDTQMQAFRTLKPTPYLYVSEK